MEPITVDNSPDIDIGGILDLDAENEEHNIDRAVVYGGDLRNTPMPITVGGDTFVTSSHTIDMHLGTVDQFGQHHEEGIHVWRYLPYPGSSWKPLPVYQDEIRIADKPLETMIIHAIQHLMEGNDPILTEESDSISTPDVEAMESINERVEAVESAREEITRLRQELGIG